jgi:RNA-binding protein
MKNKRVNRAWLHDHLNDPYVKLAQKEGYRARAAYKLKEIDAALNAHGLIKVRVFSDDRGAREAMLGTLADTLDAAPIQHIGKLLVLWRPIPPKAKAEREDRKPGPRVVKVVKFSKSGNHRATVSKVKVMGNERITRGGIVKRQKTPRTSVKKSAPE